MLVVVLIIGILATFFGLSIGNRSLDERMETEAKRLQKTLQLASEEAEAKGMQIGFRYTREGYEFLGLNEAGQWAVLTDTGPLRPRETQAPFEMLLCVEGHAIAPALPRDNPKSKLEPQVLLLSSGELTPFQISVQAPKLEDFFRITGEALGALKVERSTGRPTCEIPRGRS